jgi:hypothetical protein
MLAKTAQLFCRQVGPFLRCIGYSVPQLYTRRGKNGPTGLGFGPIFELICCVMLRLVGLVHPTHQVGNAPF